MNSNDNYINDTRQALLSVILALIAMTGVTYVIKIIGLGVEALIMGFVLMLLSIPFHRMGGKKDKSFYYVSWGMNAVSSGFSVGALYSMERIPMDIMVLLISLGISLIVLLILYKYITFRGIEPVRFRTVSTIIGLLVLILVGFYCFESPEYAILFFLLAHVSYSTFMFEGLKEVPGNLRYISLISYGIYIVITIIVIMIITEGDFDLGFDFGRKKRKEQQIQ